MRWLLGRFKSFTYALNGVWGILASGPNMLIMLVAIAVVVVAGLYFRIAPTEWALVTVAIAMVMVAEAFNTAIEKLTDLVKPERDPRAGLIKDLAAGGVLLAAVAAAVIGVLVFGKYLFSQ